MRKPATQRGALTLRRQRSSGCRRQGEARPLPTRLQRVQQRVLLPPGSHDDLRENQRRFSPSALHTISPPSSKLLLHMHGHPQAFKQRRGSYFYYNRAAIGLACAQATAMRIDIAPHKPPQKAPSPRPRPPPLSHPSTRPPPRLITLDT
jgi:hypothetical protein